MKRAQQAGVPRVVNCIAKHYAELEDSRMIDYCRIGLDECNDICAYLLAECYKEGKFVEKDYCYAAELYEKCVEWYHYPKYADMDSGAYPLASAYWALGELHENNLLPDATIEKHFITINLARIAAKDAIRLQKCMNMVSVRSQITKRRLYITERP